MGSGSPQRSILNCPGRIEFINHEVHEGNKKNKRNFVDFVIFVVKK
jgi:hypothetical protein